MIEYCGSEPGIDPTFNLGRDKGQKNFEEESIGKKIIKIFFLP